MGAIMPPVDVNQSKLMGELQKRIKKGPITMVFVYADWCGHCQTYKDTYSKLENNPNRNIQIARVRDDMFPSANITNAKIEGYPSVILVDKNNKAMSFKSENGASTNDIPEHSNVEKMNNIIEGDMSTITREKSGVNNNSVNNVSVNNNSGVSRPTAQNLTTKISESMEKLNTKNTNNVAVPRTEMDSINNNSKKYMDSFIEQNKKPAPQGQLGGNCGCDRWTGGAGGLYGLLSSVASSSVVPIALLGTGAYLAKKRATLKKTLKSKRRAIKKTRKH